MQMPVTQAMKVIQIKVDTSNEGNTNKLSICYIIIIITIIIIDSKIRKRYWTLPPHDMD